MSDEVTVTTYLPAYLLIAMVSIATLTDITSHRIPNTLLAPAFALALMTGAFSAGLMGVVMALAGMGVGLAMLLPVYALGAMGAGDVKLLGVAGAFLGPAGALMAGLFTFVAGAVLGLLWIGWQIARPMAEYLLARAMETRNGGMSQSLVIQGTTSKSFAYAPAIAIGVVLHVWQQGWQIPATMV